MEMETLLNKINVLDERLTFLEIEQEATEGK